MGYSDGNEAMLGDLVKIDEKYRGTVVACMDHDQYGPEESSAQWAYLRQGVMIETDFAGLVHYTEPLTEEMVLPSRERPMSSLTRRLARIGLFYVVASLLMLPGSILISFPRYPTSPLGWLAYIALPLPLTVAAEWLIEYRPFRLLQPLDTISARIERSPLRLLIVLALIVTAGAIGFACLAYFS